MSTCPAPPVHDLAGWNPLTSASAGSAFGGILAALVIAVSIQLALSEPVGSARHRWTSLAAAAPTLATLLLATYLYIMLDGMPTSSAELIDASGGSTAFVLASPSASEAEVCQALGDVNRLASEYANISARGFAVAGSVLALGAFMTLFLVAAAVRDGTEHQTARSARVFADSVLIGSAAVISYILIWGYSTGANTYWQCAGKTVVGDTFFGIRHTDRCLGGSSAGDEGS